MNDPSRRSASGPRAGVLLVAVVVTIAVAASGCGGAASPSVSGETAAPVATPTATSTAAAPESPGGASPATGTPAPPTAPTDDPAAAARAALASRPWATTTLTDVTTGQPFTIADYARRTVFVEAMAIWCTNCRQQQGRFKEALARLDPATVAYVVLTVEPAESADDLARYRAGRGFTGTYAVAGRDVSAALEAEFGPNVLNPPSVPLIVVTPSGEVSFGTGGEGVDEIVAIVAG